MSNPLNKYFRQPAIYVELPSQGRWWRPGSIQLPPDRKVPICSMTARDEILLRTPDALLNGVSVVEVLQSCCSVIKDAWAIPNVDVDALLISIRIASYGNILDVDSVCPHCQHANRHGVDLGSRLSQIRCPDYDKTAKHDDLVIKFKPMSYFAINRENSLRYHQEKLLQAVENSSLTEEQKIEQVTEHAKRMLESSILGLALQTDFIQLEDGTKVNELDYIREFYTNIDGETVRSLQAKLVQIISETALPDINVACESCNKSYTYPLELDFANFFGQGF